MSAERQTFTVAQAMQTGLQLFQAGRLAEAEQAYQQVLQIEPDNLAALYLLGAISHQIRKYELSVQLIDKALAIGPEYAEAFFNRGLALQELKRYEEALASYDRALAIKPDFSEALSNRGNALQELKRTDEALASYDRALAIKPGYAEALYNRGVVLHELKRYEEALASYDRALAVGAGTAEVLSNRGNTLQELKRTDEALASFDRALAINPYYAEALMNRGIVLQTLKRHGEALASFDRALAIKPGFAEALSNRGIALLELKRTDEALASFDRALAIKPGYAEALYSRGVALQELKRHEEAVASWRGALAVKPDFAEAHVSWLHGRQHLCQWAGFDREVETLRDQVVRQKSGRIVPFSFVALPGIQAAEQLLCAQQFADDKYEEPLSRPPLYERTQPRANGPKLRLGYLSADFREHAVSYLLAEVIELHDRNRFEVFAYSYGPGEASGMRHRLQAAFDTFRDIAPLPDAAASQLILEDRVDVLVDLAGYTMNTRLQIAARRPAPLQVNWLGYPGTLGHPRLADYIIGDPVVTPLEHAPYYSEALALMPHCYQPNDRRREIGRRPSRSEVGLPAEGFVFCCLNQAYKITSAMFDLWCGLLRNVPGSLLWLLEPVAKAQANLRREAVARGIAADRLVFAPIRPLAEHLARFQLADLAIDTYPYTSHTTASDALWAGIPLVTLAGDSFVSRVAASILQAAGLPELVARTADSYFELALGLATRSERLRKIREKLSANRMNCPLFDSERFTRDLERLFQRMRADQRAGIKRHIVLGEK